MVAFTGDNPSSLVGMGADAPRHRGHQPRHERHDVRGDGAPRAPIRAASATSSATRPAASWPCAASPTARSPARRSPSRWASAGTTSPAAITEQTQPGNGGNLLLPYFVPEITPRLLAPKPRWFGSDELRGGRGAGRGRPRGRRGAGARRCGITPTGSARRPTPSWSPAAPRRTRASCRSWPTSSRPRILPLKVGNSSALGGALRAAQAVGGLGLGAALPSVRRARTRRARSAPIPAAAAKYEELMAIFETRLAEAVAESNGKR